MARHPPTWGEDGVAWHAVGLMDAKATSAVVSAVAPTDLLHLAWATAA